MKRQQAYRPIALRAAGSGGSFILKAAKASGSGRRVQKVAAFIHLFSRKALSLIQFLQMRRHLASNLPIAAFKHQIDAQSHPFLFPWAKFNAEPADLQEVRPALPALPVPSIPFLHDDMTCQADLFLQKTFSGHSL
ncbi:hypothetical protein [Paenibacillus durus]|uniref:Uncharacterized protein n=1 Tax=Paenibacillus durus ATCC 35681 TaxID=1333534 RepID=A0A0F7FF39_PAEDU|nr:hypothetical protein [Paenibacillus durus]AKG37315.1 hypothetical protein VK70_24850 [Paenibacillus durus ATCC 35681]